MSARASSAARVSQIRFGAFSRTPAWNPLGSNSKLRKVCFGSGYSSLSYVNRFPFDTIKIDQSFIREMNEASNALHIIDTILRLSAGLGISVVAEGVETAEQLQRLVTMGCSEIQGFLVAYPLPVSSLAREVPPQVMEILENAMQRQGPRANTLGEIGTLMRDAVREKPAPGKQSA